MERQPPEGFLKKGVMRNFAEFTKKNISAGISFLIKLNSLEHVYMKPKVNSNRFEISLQGKISLRREVTSLSAFT